MEQKKLPRAKWMALVLVLGLVFIGLATLFGGMAQADEDPLRELAIELNPSEFPSSFNWAENWGSVGVPGEIASTNGVSYTWAMVIQDLGEPRPHDGVNQRQVLGNFDQNGCPEDDQEIGVYTRYTDADLIPNEMKQWLDKIGWRPISSDESENRWNLGPGAKLARSELTWCSDETAPNWLVDFDPSLEVPYGEPPVESFSGPQYVPGRNWDHRGWEFELVKVLDNAWDWKWYLPNDVVYQWACPVEEGLGFFTNYSPVELVEDHPEIQANTLDEIGYVFIPRVIAHDTLHIGDMDYWAETKAIWCQAFEPPEPSVTPEPEVVNLPIVFNNWLALAPSCPIDAVDIYINGQVYRTGDDFSLEGSPYGLRILSPGETLRFEIDEAVNLTRVTLYRNNAPYVNYNRTKRSFEFTTAISSDEQNKVLGAYLDYTLQFEAGGCLFRINIFVDPPNDGQGLQ